jgi:hypothetical protein
MALDATVGGSAADTYGTLAEADAYFTARQSAAWGSSNAVKEYALIKAATFLDNVYRGRWKGLKANSTQARAWPRSGVQDVDGYAVSAEAIPQQVKNAQFEAAKLIAAGTEMEATIERAVKREQVGSLSVEYMDGATLQARYPQVTNYLSDLVVGGSAVNASFGNSQIVRS